MKWTALMMVGAIGLYAWTAYTHMYNGRTGLTNIDPTPTTMTIPADKNTSADFVYVALGDSLTTGTGVNQATDSYPYQLGLRLSKNTSSSVNVINLGIPGAVAADVLIHEVPQLVNHSADIVTIAIGTNDVHNRTPLSEFKKSFDETLSALQKNSGQLYVLNIPYLGDKHLVWPPYRWYIDRKIQTYNRVIEDVAGAHKTPIIDLYNQTKADAWTGGNYYSVDKFHPSAQGYLVWSSIIYDALNH